MEYWFTDLLGATVSQGSTPTDKTFVIDPNKELEIDWINYVLAPSSYEQTIITNADTLDVLSAFAKVFDSRGEARKAGFSGQAFPGIEFYGTKNHTFCVWQPNLPSIAPTFNRKRLKTEQWWFFLSQMKWLKNQT